MGNFEVFKTIDTDVAAFIEQNENADLTRLALKKNPFPSVSWNVVLNQIDCRKRATKKLPTWHSAKGLLWPSKISLEQTSSEQTADYKAMLLSPGNILIDATGGFGVDDYYFSLRFDKVYHCELNEELSAVAAHNFKVLSRPNIDCIHGDGLKFIENFSGRVDVIYADPSRRSDLKGKVFRLADCLPNVPGHLEAWFEKTDCVMIKTSPLLDLSAGIAELRNVAEIHIVAVQNEVREIIWVLRKNFNGPVQVNAVDLPKPDVFKYNFGDVSKASHRLPMKYLYEPNAAVLKSGGFDKVAESFGVSKLHKHSHLYTSDIVIKFPGKAFKIERTMLYSRPAISGLHEIKKANIVARNFPLTVEEIRKRHKIADGGDTYCFFTTDLNDDKIVLICTKI